MYLIVWGPDPPSEGIGANFGVFRAIERHGDLFSFFMSHSSVHITASLLRCTQQKSSK